MNIIRLSVLLVGIAVAQERPHWIDDPASAYPVARYLSAVGSGDTRQAAENDAASKLSMIFRSTITAEQSITDRYTELFSAPQQSTFQQQTDVRKTSSVTTSQTLYNFRIGETYTDGMGRTYALAVIERAPTAEIYRKKIAENDTAMMRYLDRYRRSTDPVERYAGVNAASVFSAMNDGLKKQLLIILPGETIPAPGGYDDQKVMQLLAEARKDVPFAVAVQNDSTGSAAAMIRETISEMGFPTAEKGALTIRGTVAYRSLDLASPQSFVRWSYDLSVVDRSGTAVISLSENGREGHVTPAEAVARASRTMKQKVKKNLTHKIDTYFDSLVRK